MTDENNHLDSTNNKHCHPRNDVEIKVAKVVERMNQQAKDETMPIPKIYQESL